MEDPVVSETSLDIFLDGKFHTSITVLDQEIESLVRGLLFLDKRFRRQKPETFRRDGNLCHVTLKQAKGGKDKIIGGRMRISPDAILKLAQDFTALPTLFEKTGSVHTAALASSSILFWAEDISRRHAVHKLIGKCLETETDFTGKILFLTCRVTADILDKAIIPGIPVVLSLSAPTREAVESAREHGITLCGFVRNGRFNVYSGAERIG